MGRQKGGACRRVVGGRAVSTFLTERDLAGLKVCSVSSSPSIVSVQSDRGASCNSKPSQQSPPGPAWKGRAHAAEAAKQRSVQTRTTNQGRGRPPCRAVCTVSGGAAYTTASNVTRGTIPSVKRRKRAPH